MKKKLICVLAFMLVSYSVIASAAINITVDNKPIVGDTEPKNIDGRVLLPVRTVFEAIGAKVSWNADEKKITAVKGDRTVEMYIDKNYYYVNGKTNVMDSVPLIIDGRTYVPVRYVAQAFGLKTDWDEKNKTVIVTSEKNKEILKSVEKATEVTTYSVNDNVDTTQEATKKAKATQTTTVKHSEATTETTTMYSPDMCGDIPDVKSSLIKIVFGDIKNAVSPYNIGNYTSLNRFKNTTMTSLTDQWTSKAVSPSEKEFVKQSISIYKNLGQCYKKIDAKYNKNSSSSSVIDQAKQRKEKIDGYLMSYYKATSLDDVKKVSENLQKLNKSL